MRIPNELKVRDLERLSAYLDGELSAREAGRLEARIKEEPGLEKAFNELQATRDLLSALPRVRPPRNFMLSSEMAGVPRRWTLYPVFRFATVVATVAFAVLIGMDVLFVQMGGLRSAESQVFNALEVQVEKSAETEPSVEFPQEAVEAIPELGAGEQPPAVEAPRAASDDMLETFGPEEEEAPLGEALVPQATQSALLPLEATQVPTPVPLPSETQALGFEGTHSRPSLDPIHIAEIVLGVSTLVLVAITLLLRRTR
jgi:hypothetical protein